MDAVLRALAIYIGLLLIFRIAGKRSLSQYTPFDFVLLLIIGESTQQALLGDDFSVTNCLLVVVTLVGFDVLMSLLKQRSRWFEHAIDGVPLILIDNGKLLQERMNKVRVDEADVLDAARKLHGLERLDQIKYAILECSGGISIIPRRE